MQLTVERIKIRDFIYLIFLSVVFFPSFFTGYHEIYRLLLFTQAFIAIALIGYNLINIKKRDVYLWLCIAFYVIQSLSTFCCNRDYFVEGLRESLCSLCLILLVHLFVVRKNRAGLVNLARLFSIYVILHFLQVMFFPDVFPKNEGMLLTQNIFFLGIRNQVAQQLIPMTGIIFIIFYMKKERRSLFALIVGVLAILASIQTKSSTCIVAVSFLVLLYVIVGVLPERIVNIKNVGIGYVVINILLVFTQAVSNLPVVANLLQRFFGKDASFSNRTMIWLSAFNNFKESPLLGIGRRSGKAVMTFKAVNEYDTDASYSAHNALLQTIVESGILGLIPLVLIVLFAIKNASLCVNKKHLTVILIGVIAVMVSFLMEAYDLPYFLILIGFVNNIKELYQTFERNN